MLALATLLLAGPQPAAACSCMYSEPSREVLPADGATAFPTDGALRVVLYGDWPPELRPDVAAEYRLRGPDGALVPLKARLAGTVLELRPKAALAPVTTYTLERAFPYRHGRLLTDAQRWAAAKGGRGQEASVDGIALRWLPDRRLTTGPGPEDRQPESPIVTSARTYSRSGGGDCGPGESVVAELELPTDLLPTDLVALELHRQGIAWRFPYRPPTSPGAEARPTRALVSDLLCTPDKVHVELKDGGVEVRALVMTAAGHVVADPAWTLAEVATDDPWTRPPRNHQGVPPTPERTLEAISRLRDIPVDDSPAVAAPGPAACPHGLETAERRVLPDRVWPQLDRGLLGPGAGWLLVEEGKERVPLPLDGAAPGLDPLQGFEALSLHGDELLRLSPRQGGAEAPLVVALHAADGTERWRTRLGVEAKGLMHDFAAVGPDRVLVGWHRWEPELIRHVHWALLDRADGRPVAQGDLADFSPEERRVAAAAWHDGHFVLAWTWVEPRNPREPERGPTGMLEGNYLTWLGPDGQVVRTVPQPGELGRISALLSTEAGLVAVGHASPDLVFGRLDAQGGLAQGPVLLNLGAPAGGDLHLGHWQGLSAVLWNARSSGGAWVSVVDEAGVAARPLNLGAGRGSLDAVLRADEQGLWVGYGESGHHDDWAAVIERLACREAPVPGPPPLLADPP